MGILPPSELHLSLPCGSGCLLSHALATMMVGGGGSSFSWAEPIILELDMNKGTLKAYKPDEKEPFKTTKVPVEQGESLCWCAGIGGYDGQCGGEVETPENDPYCYQEQGCVVIKRLTVPLPVAAQEKHDPYCYQEPAGSMAPRYFDAVYRRWY